MVRHLWVAKLQKKLYIIPIINKLLIKYNMYAKLLLVVGDKKRVQDQS